MTFTDAMTQVSRFTTLANAQSFRNRTAGGHAIVMGDHPQYWVATNRAASVLARNGYEIIG